MSLVRRCIDRRQPHDAFSSFCRQKPNVTHTHKNEEGVRCELGRVLTQWLTHIMVERVSVVHLFVYNKS